MAGLGVPYKYQRLLAENEAENRRQLKLIRLERERTRTARGRTRTPEREVFKRSRALRTYVYPEMHVFVKRLAERRGATIAAATANIIEEVVGVWHDQFPQRPILHLRAVDSPSSAHCSIRLDHMPAKPVPLNWEQPEANLDVAYGSLHSAVISFIETGHTVADICHEVNSITTEWKQHRPKPEHGTGKKFTKGNKDGN